MRKTGVKYDYKRRTYPSKKFPTHQRGTYQKNGKEGDVEMGKDLYLKEMRKANKFHIGPDEILEETLCGKWVGGFTIRKLPEDSDEAENLPESKVCMECLREYGVIE